MRTRTAFLVVAVLFAAFTLNINSAQADTFGSGTNTFTIDFVNIGNAGNLSDTTGYGAVVYEYRIGKYEISQDQIDRATANGMSNVTAGAWTGNQPAANITWYEAAAFVNWLNTSTGKQAAYDLTWTGSAWSMNLWSGADAWQLGGENLYRHKNAYYFLPSDNEWYKAAYFNPAGSNYFLYPTGSDTAPIAVASGTDAGTAVYFSMGGGVPAAVTNAGGLSPYATMGQGGNVADWVETSMQRTNDSATAARLFLGGGNLSGFDALASTSSGSSFPPQFGGDSIGFRVASVPEPSTYALLLMTGAGALWWARRGR